MERLLGKVLWFDTIGRQGVLEDLEGNRYEFLSEVFLKSKQKVSFSPVVVQNIYLADEIKCEINEFF